MIGIQEDVLNMFLISHFLILISVGVLVFAFSLLLFLKMNQGRPGELSQFYQKLVIAGIRQESRSWFFGGNQRIQPQRVYEEPRQRGFFGRLTR